MGSISVELATIHRSDSGVRLAFTFEGRRGRVLVTTEAIEDRTRGTDMRDAELIGFVRKNASEIAMIALARAGTRVPDGEMIITETDLGKLR